MVYGKKFLPKKNTVKETPIQLESISVVYNEYLNRLSLLESCTNSEERTILEAQVEVLYEVSFEDIKKTFHDIKEKIKELWNKFTGWIKRIWNKIWHNEKVVDAKVKTTEEALSKAANHEASKPESSSSSSSSSANNNSSSTNSSNTTMEDEEKLNQALKKSSFVDSDGKIKNEEKDPFIDDLNDILKKTETTDNSAEKESEEIKQDLGGRGGLSKSDKKKIHDQYRGSGKNASYGFERFFLDCYWSFKNPDKPDDENSRIRYAVGSASEYSIDFNPDLFNNVADEIEDFVDHIYNRIKVATANYGTKEADDKMRKLDRYLDKIAISDRQNGIMIKLSDIRLCADNFITDRTYNPVASKYLKNTNFNNISDVFTKYNAFMKEVINAAEKDKKLFDSIYNRISASMSKMDKSFKKMDELENTLNTEKNKMTGESEENSVLTNHFKSELSKKKLSEKDNEIVEYYRLCLYTIKGMNKFKNSVEAFNKNYIATSKMLLINLKEKLAANGIAMLKYKYIVTGRSKNFAEEVADAMK